MPFSESEIAAQLTSLPGWELIDGAITREYKTTGWASTLMFVNALGFVAQAADHHPDLQVSWGKVIVRLNTHSEGGVTAKDITLAREIERIASWRPPEGSTLRGPTTPLVRGA